MKLFWKDKVRNRIVKLQKSRKTLHDSVRDKKEDAETIRPGWKMCRGLQQRCEKWLKVIDCVEDQQEYGPMA